MLTTLRIKNLALVDDLTLEFAKGFTAITGETGAGKSIIIGALKLVLGERADRTLLRSGCDSCTVEAVFDVGSLKAPLADLLETNGLEPCEDHQLVLKRVFTAAGSNRQFVNGSPTTLGTLSTLGNWLVDMHGPHDHQSLLHRNRQLDILDAHAGLAAEREEFASLLRQHSRALALKAGLIIDEATYVQQLDLLKFQVQEITAARLSPEEEQQVPEEYRRVGNASRLLELGRMTLDDLLENETSLLTQAGQITRRLQELTQLDPTTEPLLQQHEQAIELLHELVSGLSRYVDQIEIDPDRLQALEERLNLIQSFKRKYGPAVTDIIEFGEKARAKLHSLERRDEELQRLNHTIARLEQDLIVVGGRLSDRRRKMIPRLCKEVSRQLDDLGFSASRLDVTLDSNHPQPGDDLSEVGASGFDTVEFQFAPNPGEPARPLRAIASSGELARVMLALKTVLASEDQIPLLVFDEVDANVGGETTHAVADKMMQIASRRQVFCITHLPQVAAPATAHYVVSKGVEGGRTLSRITPVAGQERIQELARMLGGNSEAAVLHAREMLDPKGRRPRMAAKPVAPARS